MVSTGFLGSVLKTKQTTTNKTSLHGNSCVRVCLRRTHFERRKQSRGSGHSWASLRTPRSMFHQKELKHRGQLSQHLQRSQPGGGRRQEDGSEALLSFTMYHFGAIINSGGHSSKSLDAMPTHSCGLAARPSRVDFPHHCQAVCQWLHKTSKSFWLIFYFCGTS